MALSTSYSSTDIGDSLQSAVVAAHILVDKNVVETATVEKLKFVVTVGKRLPSKSSASTWFAIVTTGVVKGEYVSCSCCCCCCGDDDDVDGGGEATLDILTAVADSFASSGSSDPKSAFNNESSSTPMKSVSGQRSAGTIGLPVKKSGPAVK